MPLKARRWLALLAPALVLGAWSVLLAAVAWSAMPEDTRAAVAPALETLVALAVLAWLIASALLARWTRQLFRDHVEAPARLQDHVRIRIGGQTREPLPREGAAEVRALAGVIDSLSSQRDQLRDDMAQQVREASRNVEQERRRLAALMAELQQSVVVCNLDGRILLYNNRARLQYQALAPQPALADGAGAIGLGRSIYAVFDPKLVAHALDTIRRRLDRGAANASAQFVTTTRSGQLLRVQVAAVRDEPTAGDDAAPSAAAAPLSGFVLLLENLTRDFEQQSLRDQLLHAMTEGSRSSLANLQAALEMLEFPDLDAPMRERFLAVVREESAAMSERVQQLAQTASKNLKTRWPMEDMLAADLVAVVARRIHAIEGLQVSNTPVDPDLWLRVESFSLMQALAYLAERLAQEFAVRRFTVRLAAEGPHAQLDLVWQGTAMSTETVMAWELDPIRIGGESTPLTVRDVVDRHGGAFWFERNRARHEAWFRILLPLGGASARDARRAAAVPTLSPEDHRPTFYDFDLFKASDMARDLQDRRLDDLSYTVFDTETTGLDPSRGDEIIQIGATRIVNGRLLHHEGFEQLVDPRRTVPVTSTKIHGITPDMLHGQPDIRTVLGAFHAYAQDTVLVAHNAAFDMRFLQLKEAASGVVFDQPVLDTLLLSDLVHPQQESHGLEALAQRLGVQVVGRHTALADAIVTAEVFLKLVPLLADKGIHTLGQAREAAQKSRFARVQY
ncbi:exonuclease domain-containing protein [Comamonadaceae bacterium G21597-S1]|nr:exonuclease domain-containing protein [Comamonadaceae bacterium G21597-S1]